jgi:hypothetical protein
MRLLISLAMVVLLLCAPIAWAGCKSDCQDEYESEVQSCREQHDDPDEADMLQMCIENAKSEYQSCINECET